MKICPQRCSRGGLAVFQGKGSAWAQNWKQAGVKALERMIAFPHMRSGLGSVADNQTWIFQTQLDLVLEERKIRGFFEICSLALLNISEQLQVFNIHSPSPTNNIPLCDYSTNWSWHILLPANVGAPSSVGSVLSKCVMLNTISS